MATIKLSKHEAKILKRLLASDKKDFVESLRCMTDMMEEENFDKSGFKKKDYPSLIGHTSDAVMVINAVLNQL